MEQDSELTHVKRRFSNQKAPQRPSTRTDQMVTEALTVQQEYSNEDGWESILALKDDINRSKGKDTANSAKNLKAQLHRATETISHLEWQNQELQKIIKQLQKEK